MTALLVRCELDVLVLLAASVCALGPKLRRFIWKRPISLQFRRA